MKVIKKIRMTDLSFDKGTNKLFFIIKHYTYTSKIARYKTVNYVRYPIYEGYSERIKLITSFNKEMDNIISSNWNLYRETKNKEINYWYKETGEGWKDLRHSSNFSFSYLNDKKGVYIIWNKTKDKHYVGQSKNVGKRLNQHFLGGEVRNVIFAKDWYAGDYFCYKAYFCQTKDELDALEKQKIDEFFAFDRGYNSTGGNQ